MYIPTLPLPSNPTIQLEFRASQASDALEYCNATPDTEEEFTTRYLNSMQKGDVLDSALWTAQDRRTALYWIWCHSRLDRTRTLTYTCNHCGELHRHTYDLLDMGADIHLLQVPPFIEVTIPVEGEPVEWILKPLDGNSMVQLQRLYSMLPPKDHPSYEAELLNLRYIELALQAHFKDQPEDCQEISEQRYEKIKKMYLYSEFAALAANVRAMQETLHHGLPIFIHKGEPKLYAPPHICPVKAKEGLQLETRLYFPFRAIEYLSVNVPGFMVEDDS